MGERENENTKISLKLLVLSFIVIKGYTIGHE